VLNDRRKEKYRLEEGEMRWGGRRTGIRVRMWGEGSRWRITLSEGNNFLVMNDPSM
jgi:hypothetical protein